MEENIMKKINLAAAVLGTITMGGLVSGLTAQADTLTGQTTTSLTVKPGTLDLTPSQTINFDDVTIKREDQTIKEKDASKVAISDLRGSIDAGWTLKVKKTDAKDGGFGAKEDRGVDISLAPSSEKEYVTSAAEFTVNTEEQKVAEITGAKIQESDFDTEVALGANLHISSKTFAQTYKTTLTWNLTAGPETSNPGA